MYPDFRPLDVLYCTCIASIFRGANIFLEKSYDIMSPAKLNGMLLLFILHTSGKKQEKGDLVQ